VDAGAPNEEVALYEGHLEILKPDDSIAAQGEGRIELRWLPRPAIVVSLPSFVHLLQVQDDLRVRLPSALEFAGVEVAAGHGGLKIEIDSTRQGWLDGQNPPLERVFFFLTNFVETRGAMIRRSKSSRYAGRQAFVFGEWSLKIDLLPDGPQKALRGSGGFGFTHAVSIQREDGATFETEEVASMLDRLYWVFSFVKGARTTPALTTGYVARREVWRDWSLRVVDTWTGHHSMFPWHGELAPLVSALWKFLGQKGSRTIETCIHWYIEANNCRGGVEGALVMTLTAFERLAWLELVRLRRCLSRDGFEKLAAHDKISTLLSILEVPLDIPAELPRLYAEAKKRSPPLNGVRQLCELRNRVVHPPKQDEEDEVAMEMREEAWRYGLHLLELTLLRLSGYEGMHANRIVHDTTLVPWAKPTPQVVSAPKAKRRAKSRRKPS